MKTSKYKLDPNRSRRMMQGKPIIQQGEFAKILAQKAGVNQADALACVQAFPRALRDLTVQGYVVNLDNFGNFFIRKIKVPSYSYKRKVGTGMKDAYAFVFRKVKAFATEINDILLGREKDD